MSAAAGAGAGAGAGSAAATVETATTSHGAAAAAARTGSASAADKSADRVSTTAERRRLRKQRQRDRKRAEAEAAAKAEAAAAGISEEDRKAADELKRKGNVAFMGKDYETAIQLYTDALKLDASNKYLLGNRSAAFRALGNLTNALDDASAAVACAPDWPKGYFRQAEALVDLKRPRDAATACSIAHRLDPRSAGIKRKWHECLRTADKIDRTVKVTSTQQWLRIFKHVTDKRLRLGVMANFWNKSTKVERFAVFHKFMEVMSANSADTLARYTADHMIELPLQNYENIVIPPTWMEFFTTQESDVKVEAFKLMWDVCSGAEQSLIVKDFRYFFLSPVGHMG